VPDTMFSQKETEYLNSQRLARIATASSREGFIQPDVVAVGFDFDGEYIYVSGMNLLKSTKYKNVQKNPRSNSILIKGEAHFAVEEALNQVSNAIRS
jgi:hypothetical protein